MKRHVEILQPQSARPQCRRLHGPVYLRDLSGDMADMPSADRVWWSLLEQFGFRQKRMIDRCPDCYTVADFCEDHPRGIYILGPHEHAVAVIHGDYWDSWDSGQTVPTYFFRR